MPLSAIYQLYHGDQL